MQNGKPHFPPLCGFILFTLVLLLPAPATLLAEGWTAQEMMQVKRVGGVSVSPDGGKILFTVTEPVLSGEKSEYLTQVYVGNSDGSEVVQFTRDDKSSSNPAWSPDGRYIAFTSARSGKNNIWIIPTSGGEARQLTDVKTGVNAFKWSPDGSSIAFVRPDEKIEEEERKEKEREDSYIVGEEVKMNHLWVIDFKPGEVSPAQTRRLTGGKFNVGAAYASGFDWSPDNREIAFTHTPTPSADHWPLADISVVNVSSGEVRSLLNSSAAESAPLYSPDGNWLAYLKSDDPPTWGFTTDVCLIRPDGNQDNALARTFDRRADIIGWAADNRKIYCSEIRGTVTRLSALPVDGKEPQDLDTGDKVLGGISLNRSGRYLGFTSQTDSQPEEAYVSPLTDFSPVKVSRANEQLPAHELGMTEVIRWKSTDGLEIEGLLTLPAGYRQGKRYPLLLVIHGGPMGVFTRNFSASPSSYPVAAFASAGYAVLRCNIRGSSGYGRNFRYANYGDWGGKDYQDLTSGVDNLIEKGIADPERLGVMGWSYGGYMTSWIITQTDRFKAASIGAPVTNLMSFTGTSDIHGFLPDYFGAEFWENFEAYRDHSAMFNIARAATPALIQQGDQDVRVPISQGYELYNALKRKGVETVMVVYPREGHGLGEPKHVLDAMRRNLEWFAGHIPTN